MRILLYAKALEQYAVRLKDAIKIYFPEEEIEVYKTVKSLSARLRQPVEDPEMAILLISNRNDLMDILSIQHFFRDTPIILFTPDNEAETIALAHQLRPRFLSDLQGDFRVVTEVLKKWSKTKKRGEKNVSENFSTPGRIGSG